MTQIISESRHPALRFGGAVQSRETGSFRQAVEQAGRQSGRDDLILRSVNDSSQPTRLHQGKRKLRKAGVILALLAATVGMGKLGISTWQGYEEAQPSDTVVSDNENMKPSWDALVSKAHAADQTGGTNNARLEGEFYKSLNGFMTKLVQTMKENPQGLDQELVEQLSRNPDFMPLKNAYPIATDYVHFMKDALAKQGVTPPQAGAQQIANVDVLNGFINQYPVLKDLPADARQQLATELTEKYKDNRGFIQPAFFTQIISGNLGSGIDGVTLDKFAKIQSEQDAIAMFDTIVNNNKNFSELTPKQREALVHRGTEILSSLEYDSPSPLWAMSALALLALSAGSLGTAGFLGLKKKYLTDALQAPGDIVQGVRKPALVVHNTDLSNPEAQSRMAVMDNSIRTYATDISRLIRTNYRENPQVRSLLSEMYGAEDQLPDADTIVAQFIYNAKTDLMAKRSLTERFKETPLDELAFMQHVNGQLEAAYEMGDYLQLGLPKGMIAPPARPVITDSMDPLEAVRLERQRIEYELQEARKVLVNRVFGQAQAEDALTRKNARLETLQQRMLEAGDLPEGTKRTEQLRQINQDLEAQEGLVAVAREKKETQAKMLTQAERTIGSIIAQYRDYHHRLSETLSQGQFAHDMDQLQALQAESQKTLSDPNLQELIDKAELERFISEAAQELTLPPEQLAMRRRLNALTQAS